MSARTAHPQLLPPVKTYVYQATIPILLAIAICALARLVYLAHTADNMEPLPVWLVQYVMIMQCGEVPVLQIPLETLFHALVMLDMKVMVTPAQNVLIITTNCPPTMAIVWLVILIIPTCVITVVR